MRSALTIIACMLFGACVGIWLRNALERLRGRTRNARGKRGELDAERVLEAQGYRIRERQARLHYEIVVDGAAHTVPLVLDFIVERGGEVCVAEVKTGTSAPRLSRPETRRQLLEYQLATDSQYVLLIDPDAQTITRVSFPIARAGAHTSRALALLMGSLLLMAAAWLWWSVHRR